MPVIANTWVCLADKKHRPRNLYDFIAHGGFQITCSKKLNNNNLISSLKNFLG